MTAAPDGLFAGLLLQGQTVLALGVDAACLGALHARGAVVRTADVLPGQMDGACLVVAPPGHPALAEAARRGVLAAAVPHRPRRAGRASLVGAGPGAADLLTVRAVAALRDADVVLYDKLVGPGVLALIPPDARRIDVGKRCGRHAMSQAAINALIVREARSGAHVVRLKGGDPFVFGRGGEELDSLRQAGVETDIVPGITAALAVAARLGVPLTHRGTSRSLHLVTAHGREGGLPDHDWAALARAGGTLAIYMGVRTLPALADRLTTAGLDPATPAVAVENASLPEERRVFGTLGTLLARVQAAGLHGPTLVLVGAVVGLAAETRVEAAA